MSNETTSSTSVKSTHKEPSLYFELLKITDHFKRLTTFFSQLSHYFHPKHRDHVSNSNSDSTVPSEHNYSYHKSTKQDKSYFLNVKDNSLPQPILSSLSIEELKKYIDSTLLNNLEDKTINKQEVLNRISEKKRFLIFTKQIPKCRNLTQIKVYPVRVNQSKELKYGWRIFIRFANFTICYGPYKDYSFAMNIKSTIQLDLHKFDQDHPNLNALAKVFLLHSKSVLESKYKPLRMLKHY